MADLVEESQKSSAQDDDHADTRESSRVDNTNLASIASTASIIASIGEVFRGTSQAPEASAENSVSIATKFNIYIALLTA